MITPISLLRASLLIAVITCACTPTTGTSAHLDITTIQVVCGGAYNPDLPPCSSAPASRTIEVTLDNKVVATGTSSSDGKLLLDVPVGDLVVSAPGAPGYMNCDTPAVTSVSEHATPVTQTCTLFAP